LGFDCRFKQIGVKRQYSASRGGGPFREKSHALAVVNTRDQTGINASHIALAAACNKNRTGLVTQPSDQGPVSDIGFGDEAAGVHAIDDEDIQPGYVIADNERRRGRNRLRRIIQYQSDATNRNQLARPALYATLATLEPHRQRTQRIDMRLV